MKAVFSSSDGLGEVREVARPSLATGQVRIAATCSLISPGTELHFAREAALRGVSRALGYCSSGRVIEAADGVGTLRVNDEVIAMGWGYAVHAEEVCVPWRLCVPIRGGIPAERAVMAGLLATAVHAHDRAATPSPHFALVVGGGLLGQLVALCARAFGAQVAVAEPLTERLSGLPRDIETISIAAGSGTGRTLEEALGGRCPAVVYVCASGEFTAGMAEILRILRAGDQRERRTVVVVGRLRSVMELSADLGNLDLRVSSRCGSGYRDDEYVHGRVTYAPPPGEHSVDENLRRAVQLVEGGALGTRGLVTHRFGIDHARDAYEALAHPGTVGVVFHYNGTHP